MKMKHLNALLLLSWLFAACGSQEQPPASPAELVVAEVGDKSITAAEFAEFSSKISEGMRQGATPLAVSRNLLNSLIDKELLLQEAQASNIENMIWFIDELTNYERSQILRLYEKREIISKLNITEEMVEAHYRATRRDRSIRLGGIMVDTEEEANDLYQQLQDGADFHQLAHTHSVHRESAERGGDTGLYQLRDQLMPEVVAKVADLEIGAIAPPVPMFVAREQKFAIFTILDEIPAPLEASEDRIREELLIAQRNQRLQTMLDSLRGEYQPQPQPQNLALLAERIDQFTGEEFALAEADAPLPVCTFSKGDPIGLGNFVETIRQMKIAPQMLIDTERAAELLDRRVIPEHLFMSEIISAGLDQDPQFRANIAAKRQELMVTGLRKIMVDQQLSVTPEEARTFYDEHPEKFTKPTTTVAIEILVSSDSLAQHLFTELTQATEAEAETLAVRHSERAEAFHHNGRINFNIYTEQFFPGVSDLAQDLEVGQVGGPVRTQRGYSVFKVVDRQREHIPYNEDSQRRARAYVLIDKAQDRYVEYVRSLRKIYPITIHEAHLKQYTAAQS